MKKAVIKKIISIAIWSFFIAVLVISLGFSESQLKKIKCTDIDVQIIDSTGYGFVESADIKELLNQKGFKIIGNNIENFPLNKFETAIRNHPSVKSAEVYTTFDGILHIKVEQRNPILRIVNYNNESYYIDNIGNLFPLSDKYTARVLVANGNINEPYNLRYTKNASNAEEKDVLGRNIMVDDLFTLAKFIENDNFFNSFIEQIFINENSEIELIPKIGKFTILLGNIDDLEEKFDNLKAFIQIGLSREGWNKYETINIKYKNQVVCKKKIDYEPTE
jgi:cell division protein FtsQ